MSWQSRFLLRGATGEPVGMDVASRGGDPVNKSLMACNAILVHVDQFLQPLPAAPSRSWCRTGGLPQTGQAARQ
jgi:hypothetical protein